MRLLRAFFLFSLAVSTAAGSAHAEVYKIDRDHSTIGFKIRHLVSWVSGSFKQYDGQFVYDPQHPESWKAEVVIEAASIDTGVAQRDNHLRSADFFNVEKNPQITFKSTGFTDVTPEHAKMQGELTINGITKPVALDVEIHGTGTDPWGNDRFGATATTTLNRQDFGLTWNKAIEAGKFLVGDEVKITIEVEGLKQK